MQRVLSLVRKAVDEYNLISDGDRIAVGVSGGKDSVLLLAALAALAVSATVGCGFLPATAPTVG